MGNRITIWSKKILRERGMGRRRAYVILNETPTKPITGSKNSHKDAPYGFRTLVRYRMRFESLGASLSVLKVPLLAIIMERMIRCCAFLFARGRFTSDNASSSIYEGDFHL